VRSSTACAAFLFCALCFTSPFALAQAVTPEQSFRSGVERYTQRDFEGALSAFRDAYQADADWRLLYNVGQCEIQLLRNRDAYLTFTRYLKDGGSQVPEDRRAGVAKDLALLLTKLGRIVVQVTPDDATVLIDDQLSAPETVVTPGLHVVTMRRDGYVAVTQKVDISAGDRSIVQTQLQTENFVREKTEATVVPVLIAKPVEPTPSRSLGPGTIGLWIGTGAAVTLGAAASGFSLYNGAELGRLKGTVDPSASDLERYAGRTKTFSVAADVLWGSAIVLAGLSVYFTFIAKKPLTVNARGALIQW
jgi:PEGA domain